jgi:hypothetical protein
MRTEPGDGVLRVFVDPSESARITRLLSGAGLWLTELRPEGASLEDVFLGLTSEPSRDMEVAA